MELLGFTVLSHICPLKKEQEQLGEKGVDNSSSTCLNLRVTWYKTVSQTAATINYLTKEVAHGDL